MRRALEAGAYLAQLILPSNVQAVVMGWVVIFRLSSKSGTIHFLKFPGTEHRLFIFLSPGARWAGRVFLLPNPLLLPSYASIF